MDKPWNTKCPSCGTSTAYQGFSSCECTNFRCQNYNSDHEDRVIAYKEYLAQQKKTEPAPEENSKKKQSRGGGQSDTIYMNPYDPTNWGLTIPTLDDDDEEEEKEEKDDDNTPTVPVHVPFSDPLLDDEPADDDSQLDLFDLGGMYI